MLKHAQKLLKLGALLLTGLLALNVAQAQDTPYSLMKNATDKLFNDINANQAKIKQDPNYLRTIVRNDLMPFVHVNYAASLVLGQHYQSTTPAQRTRYFNAFGQFIEQTYAQVLTLYKGQKIQLEQEKPLGNQTIVSQRVNIMQQGAAPIRLDFKWRKNTKTGQWQAYDMAADGVSMVETKKNEWSNILRTQGIDALTAQIEKSAAQPVVIK
ncbi:phospholipid-binding protein MlaC [Pasteurellaceae bacterium 20609_3]|uniref:phospholipid-binding protein MlaC n=1 Tax=Spirabiliibacterium mucosae TaxID=28156 RepID=UPI001AAD14B3|nr:phospholipid-binding protein MlaC [Spirabiliibacterium mucosae]MBE2898056.1 phospholipid-binding protein MlaC [Spirabiliibacterium mucosae]